MVDIMGLDKAEVLAALYNASRPQGWGWLHTDQEPMTKEQANALLEQQKGSERVYFDYVHGRVMKVNLTSDTEFDPRLYDRDNGTGAAQRAITSLRQGMEAHA